ncbi:MAG TPA: alpha/beta fold hydrolase [Gemmatimonadaceae bacterium]|nr:alpha/beta fold hydrolase [Gemmatimonadaceae bacterium]
MTTDTNGTDGRVTAVRRYALRAVLGVCVGATGGAHAQGLATCRVPDVEEAVQCATVDVPENRAAASGRTISLRVVILPSRAPVGAPRRALFYLVGGPGLPATTLADLVAAAHAPTRSTHDIVLVDQRGTGASNPLDCPLYGDSGDVAAYLGDQFPAARVRECAQRLAQRADLSQYTTVNAAEDLEAVRARLGLEKIDLDASAYGTRVAIEYMRRHPDRVRSVVLQGVVPPDVALPLTAARDAQRALDRVFADCTADPFCRTSFPGVPRELTTLLARLDRGPVSVRVQRPRAADSITVSLTRGVVADRLRIMLYSTRLSRRIPLVIHRAHEGDWTPFVTIAYELSRVVFDQLNVGAHLSGTCADDLRGDINARGSFLGDYRARMYRQACAAWPRPSPPPRESAARPVTAPVLLITGALDPVTPPTFAEAVARTMPNATVLVVPGMAHAGTDRCVEGVVTRFVGRGSMEGVDTGCVERIAIGPFITR